MDIANARGFARRAGPDESARALARLRASTGLDPEPAPDGDEIAADFSVPADADPDHHLWRNGQVWWIAFTLLVDGVVQERVRFSLGTDDVTVARRRRDEALRLFARARRWKISLRFSPRRRRTA